MDLFEKLSLIPIIVIICVVILFFAFFVFYMMPGYQVILRAVTPAEFQIIGILGSKVTLLDH